MTSISSPKTYPIQAENTSTSQNLDPNTRQKHAANPTSNVWVGASAGTGKTKVLTDRVLRLLLPRNEQENGTAPHKILCLTFTKAGANEMALRINTTLSEWAILPENTLQDRLHTLLGKPITAHDIQAARKLFAQVIDTPGGIQIMTIHAFCQSILARFPLEAGLTPNFQVLEESQASLLLTRAIDHTLKHASEPIKEAIQALSREINEDQFFQLIQDIIKERAQFEDLLIRRFGTDGLYNTLCENLDISPNANIKNVRLAALENSAFNISDLRALCPLLAASDKTKDHERLAMIQDFLTAPTAAERLPYFDKYLSFFFTQTGTPRKTVLTKAILEHAHGTQEMIEKEIERLQKIIETEKRIKTALCTHQLLQIGEAALTQYNALKASASALDFDDLIIQTYKLLAEKSSTQWVLFKLDQGLDHILVDEAQDTNPEQWKIIDALSEEFFTNIEPNTTSPRTLFIVGDEKQSIYSFQRASPEEFERMRNYCREKVATAQAKWDDIALNISFRTTKSVLQAVDKTFAPNHMRTGLGSTANTNPIEHHSFRRGQEGLVELWPLFKPEESKDAPDPWTPPTHITTTTTPAAQLAEYIADQIKGWLDRGEVLNSRLRPIKPNDIMILMRTRSSLVSHLTRALKNKNIPVSGADRMRLNDQIIVQDMLAVAAFGLLPQDDYTLACILKSPFIGFTEQELYNLSHNRPGTLWDTLQTNPEYTHICLYLKHYITLSKSLRPLEFFNTLLQTPCPADPISAIRSLRSRLGDDAIDPMEELLTLALDFERDNIPTLQYFLHWISTQQTTIKREMESEANEVRIMTTHGSKGLQAPIVILPDTIRSTRHIPGQSDKRLLWPTQTGRDTPIWSPYKDTDPKPFTDEYNKIEARLDEEYKRLLYVAMTRAEERLYIAGYHGSRKPIEDSWYNYIHSAFKNWDEIEHTKDGILRLYNPQSKDPDRQDQTTKTVQETQTTLPDWIATPAPNEHNTQRPLLPSRIDESTEQRANSPLSNIQDKRFTRGNLIHKILQFLPDLAPEARESSMHNYMHKNEQNLSNKEKQDISREILTILNHPDYIMFFGQESWAEVPITGRLENGRIISGQIDRMLITKDSIWILDFKTNRNPPENIQDVPELYHHQMKAYRDTMQTIYPNKTIKTALLWTYTPKLMILND